PPYASHPFSSVRFCQVSVGRLVATLAVSALVAWPAVVALVALLAVVAVVAVVAFVAFVAFVAVFAVLALPALVANATCALGISELKSFLSVAVSLGAGFGLVFLDFLLATAAGELPSWLAA